MVDEPDAEYVQPSAPTRPDDAERTIRDAPTARETPLKQEGVLAAPVAFDQQPSRAARSPLEQNLFDELAKAKARKAQT